MTDTTITLTFRWKTATADPRQFNQQRQVFEPNINVSFDLPLTPEIFKNWEELNLFALGHGEQVDPVLTPTGMLAAITKLENPFYVENGIEPKNENWDEWN